jgi:cytochrome c oxidase assembly protein subunit 15
VRVLRLRADTTVLRASEAMSLSLLRLCLLALTMAIVPVAWWAWRQRRQPWPARLAALTTLTLFLTFDLIVFGAFTRLTDSGLGCPDWPGCYSQASPLGAHADIHAAQIAMPTGPVTQAKAWIEMIHRYLAMVVGALIMLSTVLAWRARASLAVSPWWATATLVAVIVQGLFGKYTVTLKLYPAIVTMHLLGALVLLALLVVQRELFSGQRRSYDGHVSPRWMAAVFVLVVMQITLGGWVSTNYAVLACTGYPSCNGQWWPVMAFDQGFTVFRELGRAGHGGFLPFEALVAIHMVHRWFAVVAALAVGLLAWRLASSAATRPMARALSVLLLWQLVSGLSNVVLDWPLLAALAHTAGAAALVAALTALLARSLARPTIPALRS